MFFKVIIHDLKHNGKVIAEYEYADLYCAMVASRIYIDDKDEYAYVAVYIFDSHGQLVKAYHNAGEKFTEC
jgi:hypothetical protein